jgi:hypothetical protein
LENNSTMQGASNDGDNNLINGSVGSKTVTLKSEDPKIEPIKDDEEALATLKAIKFSNIEISDLSMDVIQQIEDAFGHDEAFKPSIARLKSYVQQKENSLLHLKVL